MSVVKPAVLTVLFLLIMNLMPVAGAEMSSEASIINRRTLLRAATVAIGSVRAMTVSGGFQDSNIVNSGDLITAQRASSGPVSGAGVFDPGDVGAGTPFEFTPFTAEMSVPPEAQPLSIGEAPFTPGAVFHGIAPEFQDRSVAERPDLQWYEAFPTKWYELDTHFSTAEIIPGVSTPVMCYSGSVPGPTFRARVGQPVVIRATNSLNIEQSIHLHGGHNPSHSDGYPNFYILPGQQRDYFYTNTVPMREGEPDFSESPSTMWYHDHSMDLTANLVIQGLAGFFLVRDQIEQDLIDSNVLPDDPYDIPVALQDKRFNPDGTIFWDPLDHNGTLGDIWIANGKAQPFFRVQRRKYRFRFLNGCNARFLEMRLSNGQSFIHLGKDSWLFPQAIESETLLLSMAQRADVVIDFTNAPSEVFLENILCQSDGRGPDGSLDAPKHCIPGAAFIKFIVEDGVVEDNVTVEPGTPLRPHVKIDPAEAVVTREFKFHRSKGAWMINGEFFDPALANVIPQLGTVERWILKNGGGGWWHPIHIHLESHQILSVNGKAPPLSRSFKNDTVILDGGGEVELLMNFRTFRGPFVFHCHNLEHEDMRMMFVFDPSVIGGSRPAPIQQSFP